MQWEEYLPHVLPSVHGCPDELAIDHVIKAARKFCAHTLVWQYDLEPILSDRGIGEYTLNIGPGEEIVRVLMIEVNGTPYEIPRGVVGRQLRRRGSGNFATMRGLQDFDLSPAPHADNLSIVCDVAVKPRMVGSEWPDDLAEHVPDIAHGAIATLSMLDERYTFFDLKKSETQLAQFNDRMTTVALKMERGYGSSRRPARVQWY